MKIRSNSFRQMQRSSEDRHLALVRPALDGEGDELVRPRLVRHEAAEEDRRPVAEARRHSGLGGEHRRAEATRARRESALGIRARDVPPWEAVRQVAYGGSSHYADWVEGHVRDNGSDKAPWHVWRTDRPAFLPAQYSVVRRVD